MLHCAPAPCSFLSEQPKQIFCPVTTVSDDPSWANELLAVANPATTTMTAIAFNNFILVSFFNVVYSIHNKASRPIWSL
jgi:hypothetical protein